ncbi:MAG: hypothetical protein WC308_03240 [archaeon]|jgi:hypothetical protein
MKSKHAKKTGKIEKKSDGKIAIFLRETPGLAVAAIAGIIVLALFIFSLVNNSSINTEELSYAQQVFVDNQSIIDNYVQQIDAEIAADPTNTADNYYLQSLRSDFEWLKEKELESYNSQIKNNIYLKELSFNLFLEVITEVNYNIAIDAGTPDYERTISSAISREAPTLELFKESDFNGEENPQARASSGNEIFNQLLKDYVAEKRLLATGSDPIERRYIEARKIINVSEIDLSYFDYLDETGYLDENYES